MNAAKKNTGAESEPLLQVQVFGTPYHGRLLEKAASKKTRRQGVCETVGIVATTTKTV